MSGHLAILREMSSGGQQPDPEGVAALLELAEAVLEDERDRGRNLDSKTASLASFSGAILALDVTLGQSLLRRELGGLGDCLLPLFFLLAAAALVVAAGVAVVGVLRPQAYFGITEPELRNFAHYPLLGAQKVEIQARTVTTIGHRLLGPERSRNDAKAQLTKVSAFALGVGLVGIAGQAFTLGLHELGV